MEKGDMTDQYNLYIINDDKTYNIRYGGSNMLAPLLC